MAGIPGFWIPGLIAISTVNPVWIMTVLSGMFKQEQGEFALLVAGIVCLALICLLTYLSLAGFSQPKDWFFYGESTTTPSTSRNKPVGIEEIALRTIEMNK